MDTIWIEYLVDAGETKKGTRVEVKNDDAAKALISEGKAKQIESPEKKALEEATKKMAAVIESSVTQAVEKITTSLAKKRPNFPAIEVGDDLEMQDPHEGYGQTKELVLGNFLKDVHASRGRTVERLEKYKVLKEKKIKAFSAVTKDPTGITTVIGEDGGTLVPEVIGNTVHERLFDDSSPSIVSRCDRRPTAGQTIVNLRLKQDSAAEADRHGGILVYSRNEAAQFTKSKPEWERDRVEVEELTAYVPFTDEMLEDSPLAIGSWLGNMVPKAIDWKLAKHIFLGTGGGQCLGILNAPALHTITKESGQAAATIKIENIDKMLVCMPTDLRAGAAFYYNPFMVPALNKLHYSQLVTNVAGTENVGGYGISDRVFIPAGTFGNQTDMLHGRPAYPLEFAKVLGTVGDIIYANLSQYQLVVKGGVTSALSMHVRFDYGETVMRWVLRVGGQPHWKKPLAPESGPAGQKISPFVVTETRA